LIFSSCSLDIFSTVTHWGYVKEESPLISFSLTPKEKYCVELGNGFRIDLPFVHTLQNLIQLTGTELTIKK